MVLEGAAAGAADGGMDAVEEGLGGKAGGVGGGEEHAVGGEDAEGGIDECSEVVFGAELAAAAGG